MLYLPQFHQLLLGQVALLFYNGALVPVRMGAQVRLLVVRVCCRRNVLASTECRHTPFMCLHVIIFFVRQCCYAQVQADSHKHGRTRKAPTCVVVFHEFGKRLLALVFAYRLWIDLSLLDEPSLELLAFGEDTAKNRS
jgi:hypothetical protein